MNGYIVYADHDVQDNETIVRLFGRLENGQSFVTLNRFKPYFFIKKKDDKKFSFQKAEKEDCRFMNFQGEEVIKIIFKNWTDLNNSFKEEHKKIEIYEADIRPQYRFLTDNSILGSIRIDGDYESSEKVDRVYHSPKISPSDFKPKLKILSVDIESEKKTGKLISVGLYSENYEKNFMVTKHQLKKTVSCKDEEECLLKFKEEIEKLDPDIITGWNIIDFDFLYLKELFARYKIDFNFGRTNENIRLRIETNFFRQSSANIPGRQVLDGINLVRDPFIKEAPSIKHAEFESFTLEDVAQTLIGKGKLINERDRHEEIEKLYKQNTQNSHQSLVDYNLRDCELVYEILEKIKIVDLGIERTQLTGLTFDRLTASIAAFDSLYIREAHKIKIVSPTLDFKEKEKRIKGGYVHSSNPGIYKNVLIMDFKSLYPSIIKTFNIDPYSFVEKTSKKRNLIEAPNGALFKNQNGILPQIIERLHFAREKAKKEERELSNYAIKTIMNSFFGVLASPNCRYFNLNMANAITHFGQFIIKLTAKEIESVGYRTIYSDTDSVFVETGKDKDKASQLGSQLAKEINDFYKNYIKKNYNRESFLELQFEKLYLSLMLPQLRGQEAAAKKRYAGLVEKNGKEELEIVGLEAIRGDWTDAAQEFQVELLSKLFHDEPIEKFIRDYIKKIREGKLDEKLVYRKSIRKSLKEYTKTTPPHVKAARKLEHLDSNIISYYITTEGPEPIQKLKHKIDYEHYIEKQIKPIANQILSVFNKNFEDIANQSKQMKLF